MSNIVSEKLEQAHGILNELDLDAWLVFVRETGCGGDPALPLILERGLTWQSALIVTRSGDRIAIVGNFDADAVRTTENWSEVVPYVKSVRDPLREALERLAPQKIAVNFSTSDHIADGLTQDRKRVLAVWEEPHRITLLSDQTATELVVKHEMLHDLLNGDPEHTDRVWEACGLDSVAG